MNLASPQLDSLLRTTRAHAHDVLLLLVAFDGVLTRYETDPDEVELASSRRGLLRRLQRVPAVEVGVVSGRLLRDLRRRVRLDGAFYVGLHGLEAVGPHFPRVQQEVGQDYRDRLVAVAARLEHVLAGVPGVRLELKGAVLALHTREARAGDAVWSRFQLLSEAADLVNADAVRIVRGHHVFELLPNVGRTKAQAITAIQQSLRQRHRASVFTVYLGEDAADDDAFMALRKRGVGAVVGRRRSAAACHLSTSSEVDQFIEELILDRAQRAPVRLSPSPV